MAYTLHTHTHPRAHTHTLYAHSDMHTYAIGKANLSRVSQGRPRLKALIDWSSGVFVPRPHLGVRQCVLRGPRDGNGSTGSDSVTLP